VLPGFQWPVDPIVGFTALAMLAMLVRFPNAEPRLLHDSLRRSLSRRLGDAALRTLPRRAETPPHWTPMHGDFTPWNLRRLDDGPLLLFDWEDAGWGPPGADEVLFQATEAALGRATDSGWAREEALAYWQERLRAKSDAGASGGRRVARVLRDVLRMAAARRRR